MRQLVLDTETTGLDPAKGHSIIELAFVEMVTDWPHRPAVATGRTRRWLIRPERAIDPEATAVHGYTDADLADAPTWAEVAPAIREELAGSMVVAHNARFDLGHLRAQSDRLVAQGLDPLPEPLPLCTKDLARRVLPDLDSHRLDDLCDAFGIDRQQRIEHGHGALLDAELLVAVYQRLITYSMQSAAA